MINTCSFGLIVIDGKKYTSDLVIFPDGHIVGSWRRKRGHMLFSDDISELIESEPDVIIAGTGVSGMVSPQAELEELLHLRGIEFIPAINQEAMEIYNEMAPREKVGACFHLTC